MKLLLNWILSAVALLIVANLVSGFHLSGIASALFAVIVVGFVNATLGFLLKILTFPLTLVTFGIFWIVINALMLELASAFVPGFVIDGFGPAFIGAIVLSLVNIVFGYFTKAVTENS